MLSKSQKDNEHSSNDVLASSRSGKNAEEIKEAGTVKNMNISRMDDGSFHVVATTDKGHRQETTHPTHEHMLGAVKDYVVSPHLMNFGGGGRFAKLKDELAQRPGVRDPQALAAAIGRKKYGAKKFDALS